MTLQNVPRCDRAIYTTSPALRRAILNRSEPLAAVAERCGATSSRLSNFLNGWRFGARSFPMIERLAALFSLSLEQSIRKVAR